MVRQGGKSAGIARAYAASGTPLQRIRAASAAYVRFAAERPHQFRLLADPPDEPAALERVADLVDEQNTKLAAALSDGITDGTITPDIDPRTAATALWAAMNGILGLSWRADRLHRHRDRYFLNISSTAGGSVRQAQRCRP
jgi:AcrR family transcriptional regulator